MVYEKKHFISNVYLQFEMLLYFFTLHIALITMQDSIAAKTCFAVANGNMMEICALLINSIVIT